MYKSLPALILVASVLSACGGGGGSASDAATPAAAPAAAPSVAPASAPSTSASTSAGSSSNANASTASATGDVSTAESAAFAYLNDLRRQAGVAALVADGRLASAARFHAGYVGDTGVVGHYETVTSSANYRGYAPADRIAAQGVSTAYTSEGLTRAVGSDAVAAVDLLVSSIYHRYGMFNGYLSHAGAGVQFKTVSGVPMVDLTIDAGNLQAVAQPARSALVVWPAAGATNVTTGFDSDSESPDPIPDKNKVGYPVSVQVDPRYALAVGSFTLTEVATGASVPVRVLSQANDASTPRHAAAAIPESVLKSATAYRVSFVGSVDGQPVNQSWQFTTAGYALTPDRTAVAPGATVAFSVAGVDPTESYFVCWDNGSLLVQSSLKFLSPVKLSLTAAGGCGSAAGCPVKVTVARDNACAVPVAQATVNVLQ